MATSRPAPTAKESAQYRDPPARPGLVASGGKITLLANHFKVLLPDQAIVYHYDVSILPDKCPVYLSQQVVLRLEEELEIPFRLAFDGKKNLYASKLIPGVNGVYKQKLKFKPTGEEREREFEIHLQLVGQASLGILYSKDLHTTKSEEYQKAIQALDIITRCSSSLNSKFTVVGRSFYCCKGNAPDLGQGRIIRLGRYQSIRVSMSGITLNVDLSATAFYKEQSVIDFMVNVLSLDGNQRDRGRGGAAGRHQGGDVRIPRSLTDNQRSGFEKEIRGLRVCVVHLSYSRKYKVKGVTSLGASRISFDCDGKAVTVKDYFSQQHAIDLKHPDLPCLHMEGKNNSVYIPLEVCKIVEQNCTRKLTPNQTANMIKVTAKPANERRLEILQKLNEADFNSDPVLKDFGITIHSNMTVVNGRVLNPPKLVCEDESHLLLPSRGQWDIRKEKFHTGTVVKCWSLVVLFPKNRYFDDRTAGEFVTSLQKVGGEKGMEFAAPCDIHYYRQGEEIESLFRNLKQKFPDLQLIVAVLDRDDSHYNEIKRVGDTMIGIVTQCIQSQNASKHHPATITNVCLKINAKLGGKNSIVNPVERDHLLTKEHIIIFGADVTHPAAGDRDSPSIAAITATMDDSFTEYNAVAKVLEHRQEVMGTDQLAFVVKEMLKTFYVRNNSTKPAQILFYRDGVSEGQFKEVIQKEVSAIQNACLMLEKTYRPGITFIVVQKRHHTRFFPDNPRDECGKSKNVPAGTVVDGVITHPREFDFFLYSHAGIQGTSRPSHYHVLRDDNRFTADTLPALTYQLCHCYSRCARSVSYPAPTYYSHLVAFRARQHLQDWEEKRNINYSSDELKRLLPEMQAAVEQNDRLKDTMYFV